MVVFRQGGLSLGWSVIRVVCHHGGISSGWSFIRVVFQQGGLIRVVFHRGGILSGWSVIRVVFHQGFHSTCENSSPCVVWLKLWFGLGLFSTLHQPTFRFRHFHRRNSTTTTIPSGNGYLLQNFGVRLFQNFVVSNVARNFSVSLVCSGENSTRALD